MRLSELSLPDAARTLLGSQGYETLYPPQVGAVEAGVLAGKSILVATPTASGKTLIAILAAAKTVLERGEKVVYLTPLRALANEKIEEFRVLEQLTKTDGARIRTLIATGDYDASGESIGVGDVIVLTNEKFDSVLRHGVTWLEKVRLFVADEVHLVGEDDRGPTLETILTKILAFAPRAQLLALSATVTNAADIARWLHADLVQMDWRPVPLREGVYDYGEIRFADGEKRRVEDTARGKPIDLAVDSVAEGGQALIFAETRRRAVSLALKAAEVTPRFLSETEANDLRSAAEEILNVAEETELSRNLARALARGAAFHHAGLHLQHRRIVEAQYRAGRIKILSATPTLAAGVNLPARRVIISSLLRYDSEVGGAAPISVLDYKQMVGRAGRPQYDAVGETVLIASSAFDAEELLEHYVLGTPEPLRSKLADEGALRTHVLATIASFPGMKFEDLRDLFSRTLFATQYREVTVKAQLSKSVDFLITEDLIAQRGSRYLATDFGRRISMLYIDPETGVTFRRAVHSAGRGKSHHAGLLHLIASSPDFSPRFPLRSKDWEEATTYVEAHESEFLEPVPRSRDYDAYDRFIHDLRSVLVLEAWVSEWHEDRILERLGVEPGDLHRAVDNGEWLLYALGEVARLLRRSDLVSEAYQLRDRVRYGIKPELLPLVQLEGIGRVRARALYQAGFIDRGRLAQASVDRLAGVPKIGPAVARRIKEQLD